MIDCLSRARLWWYHEAHHSKPTTVKTYNMALQWLSIYLTFGLDPLGQLYLCDISDKGWSIQIIHWNSVCHRWCCVSPICILEIYSRCFTEKKWLCCLTARRKFRHDEAMQLEEMTLQCNRHDAMSRVYIANTTLHKIGLLHSINQKQPVARLVDLWKWHSRNSKRVYGCRRLTWTSWYRYIPVRCAKITVCEKLLCMHDWIQNDETNRRIYWAFSCRHRLVAMWILTGRWHWALEHELVVDMIVH